MNELFMAPIIDSAGLSELDILLTGLHRCEPGHTYGPAIRDHYIIHYIISGKGYFEENGKTHELGQGDCFFIAPDYITKYYADKSEPWTYVWIGFYGSCVPSLLSKTLVSRKNPVFNISDMSVVKAHFGEIQRLCQLPRVSSLSLLSCLCGILDGLSNPQSNAKSRPEEYVNTAVSYINANIHLPLSVEFISGLIGINRKYFCRIFKKYMNSTPAQYIMQTKLEKSKLLLKTTSATVGDIARSVGYDDIFSFSRMFTKQIGTSPSQYRQTSPVDMCNNTCG